MKEDFLHYIWNNQLFNTGQLSTVSGEPIQIISKGTHNHNAGPDFSNARIKIGDTEWAGNVEIHLKSSDWYQHNHQHDDAYRNVILHVVLEHDKDVILKNGEILPVLQLPAHELVNPFQNYESLVKRRGWIPCADQLGNVPSEIIGAWIEHLKVERLKNKGSIYYQWLGNENNWKQSFYTGLFRSFGFKVNDDPFESLAHSIDFRLLERIDNPLSIESLLIGQAGMLKGDMDDPYFGKLKREYLHLKNKYKLIPQSSSAFKFSRTRPDNFPTMRLSQLAQLINANGGLFELIQEEEDVQEVKKVFKVKGAVYWREHYRFGLKREKATGNLGEASIERVIINAIVPFLFVYGNDTGDDKLKMKAVRWYHALPIEENSITNKFIELGVKAESSADGQALIELKNNYCSEKKCLNCSIGNYLMNNRNL